MQLEACRIIFAAETTAALLTPPPDASHEASWLRDLIMASPELTQRARFQTIRTSRESRHYPLKINAKDHLFEQCPMEAQLSAFVKERGVISIVLDDSQLHQEACRIVKQMEQETHTPSDVFANWVIKGIYSGTNWLSDFKQRAGLSSGSATTYPTDIDLDLTPAFPWPQPSPPQSSLSILGITSPAEQTHDFLTPLPTFSEDLVTLPTSNTQTDMYGRLRVLLPDDTNFYRVFDSDMRRWAASTLSPKNPNCHVPSDEEIQHQARWIMYDGDDPWNQTPADFPNWLWRFKRDAGITTSVDIVNPKDLEIQSQGDMRGG
jgi:hypothetical protein